MDCKNFGIGLIILSITLFLGIAISDILELSEIPEITVVEETEISLDADSLENCESVNGDVKYQTLLYVEKERHYIEIDENKLPVIIPIPSSPKKDKQNSVNLKENSSESLEKNNSEQQIPLPRGNYSYNQDLVHKEICREKNGRKNGAKINH